MNYPIWKTVEIGNMTKKKYLDALSKVDFNVSSYANSMIDTISFQGRKETIDIVKVAVSDLGIGEYPTTDAIYACLESKGLELLPAETALALRLAYIDQPLYEWLLVGMKQIVGAGRVPFVFGVARVGDGLWLDGSWAAPACTWNPDDKFLFRLRKCSSDALSSDPLAFEPSDTRRIAVALERIADAMERPKKKLKR
jgi:hypothetical protein